MEDKREGGKLICYFFVFSFLGGLRFPLSTTMNGNLLLFFVLGTLDNEGHGALYREFRRYFFYFVYMVGIFK